MAKLVCREAVHVATKKGTLSSIVGRTYDSKDPLVKAAPNTFIALELWAEKSNRSFEAATAAPGETRDVPKPKAKAKPVKKDDSDD